MKFQPQPQRTLLKGLKFGWNPIRTFIGLDPLVSWITESQKRNFVKTVLPKNIITTFRKIEPAINLEARPYLIHSGIIKLKEELINLNKPENLKRGTSRWVCFFGPPRSGISVGVKLAKSLAAQPNQVYISLRQQDLDEDFNLFVAKQLQSSELTKLEDLKPGDLRDAFKSAIKELKKKEEEKTGSKPVLIIDDCEFGIEDEGKSINRNFKAFLDLLMELSDSLSVYLTSNDNRLMKGLKQVSELREHLEFRSWQYASFREVTNYLHGMELGLTSDQINEAAQVMMGHDGDIADYVAGIQASVSHQLELFKIITRGYLQLRESLVHPPERYLELKDCRKFRIIAFSTFLAIHQQLELELGSLEDSYVDFQFPIDDRVVVPMTEVAQNLIKQVDAKITMDEVLSGIEILNSDVYNIVQQIDLPFEASNPFQDDVCVTWSSTKFQKGFERLIRDKVVVQVMLEVGIDVTKYAKKLSKDGANE